MNRKAIAAIMLTLLLISMLTLAFNIQPAEAESTPSIRVDPPEYTAPFAPGYNFSVNINLNDVSAGRPIAGYEFQLWYDSTIINATKVTPINQTDIPPGVSPSGTAFGPFGRVGPKYVWNPINPNYTTYWEPADVNDDGTVNILDVILVFIHAGYCPPPCPYDVDGDWIVGVLDVIQVLLHPGPVHAIAPGVGLVWVMAAFPLGKTWSGLDATAVRIDFTTLASGKTALHLNGTVLADGSAQNIDHVTLDGEVTVWHTQPIKIGVIGPMNWTQGQGMKEGATLAAEEINATGGIIGGNVRLVFADTLRWQQCPDNETGTYAAMQLVNASCDFVIGGYWSEAVFAAREVFMDNKTIFLITGAADDELIDDVRENYTRYKYLFRVAPVNLTTTAKALWNFSRFVLESKLLGLYGVNGKVKVAVVSENITLWDEMYENMTDPHVYNHTDVLGPHANVTYSTRVSVNETDFSDVLGNVSASRARLLIHLFSTQAGINFTKQWADSGVNATLVGINLEAQKIEFWDETEGKCEYETIIAPVGMISKTRTPIGPKAFEFYDKTVKQYGHAPIYTSWGTYEAIYTLAEAVERAGTTDSDAVVAELEQTDRNSTLGRLKFTEYHDVFCNEIGENWVEGYVRPFTLQWQKSPTTEEARLEVVYPRKDRAVPFAVKWKHPWISEADFTWDGTVDSTDLGYLGAAWLSIAGDPSWNLECDINGDGLINIVELDKIATDWGWSIKSSASSMTTKTAQTNSKTTIYFDTPTINGTAIGVGNTITINLMISDAVKIHGWQAGLIFNPDLLNCTGFSQGSFLQSIGGTIWEYEDEAIDNEAGVITPYACSLIGVKSASGSGQLAELEFEVIAEGVSDLHLRDVEALNTSSKIIPSNIIDTYTVTSSAAQISITVSNSTGQGTAHDPKKHKLVQVHSGFYDHAFSHPAKEISFNVTGPNPGFSNVTIPKTLIPVNATKELLVIIDDEPLKTEERTVTKNLTHYFIYFSYDKSPPVHNIRILKRSPVYNIDKNRYYATIQKAINTAKSGHEILAFSGIRHKRVVVNKTVTLTGENKHNTTIDGRGTGTVVNVTANNVKITGFTIQNSGNPECGILVDGSTGNNITNNILTNNYYGIRLLNSNDNTLIGNNASNNQYGILVDSSSGNSLTDNTMNANKYNLGLYGAADSDFDNTIDESNTVDGKLVYYKKKVSNTVYDSINAGTLYLIDCDNVTIRNLDLTKNVNGIFLWNTTNSKIQNVNASNNLNGIYLQGQSNHNTLTDNTVSNNELGIHLDSSDNSAIYHNSFIENTIQAKITGSYNTLWNTSYPSGGNYWSDHSLNPPFVVDEYKGKNQDEQGNDGIIDEPKAIDTQNKDNYPLVSPLKPPIYNLNTYRGYTKIQKAIDATETKKGHTIIVRNGTYSEQVTIDKSLTIIGIIGRTFINGTGTTVTITANDVTLRGFTIQGSGSTDKGILLSYADNVVISENNITKKGYGIWLDHSDSCRISGNTISNNTEGIHLEYSGSAIISRNTIANNSYGIYLIESSYNDLHRNNVTDSKNVGIYLWRSSNNAIYHNNFINQDQVEIYQSSNTWDDSAGKGNYWSDYTGADDGSGGRPAGDGVGDTQLPHQGVDWYPLMNPRTPKNDVALVKVKPYKTVVASTCRTLSITVTVENQGDYTETFNVTAYANTTEIETLKITLTSESSPTITFTWDTTGWAKSNYTITANASVVPGENLTDQADNTRTDGSVTVTCLGDVNGDYTVGVLDAIKIFVNAGPVPPEPPEYDVNCDDSNGVLDVILIFINAGPCK